MYNTNQDSYQTVNQDYNLSISLYKSIDNLVGNYSSDESKTTKSDFLEFATHEPFTCGGCDYHNH
tara:strand:+ start:88 stop:282 length:195 start_codon:yes stop_codon:yes gene_type:complete